MKFGADSNPDVDQIVDRIVRTAGLDKGEQVAIGGKPGADLATIIRCDYVRSLRRHLSYNHVKTLTAACAQIFADFNRKSIGMLSVEIFEEIAAELAIQVTTAPYSGDGGVALRGFYVPVGKWKLKRPLMYVNTAHHPLAIMTTFLHELGHHLSCDLWGLKHSAVHLFDTDYRAHLKTAHELGADIVVSIAGYPQVVARELFTTTWHSGLVAHAKNLDGSTLQRIHEHLGGAYGFNLLECAAPEQKLHYLAGMIHYAKLRWALLAEFDL
ncbi:MAG: hypothetical protein IVW54_09880 [Candidatus Binataceae bacterium]|nr:hypothetical protein [Candidatus Binataceae bacterium]